MMNVRAFVHYQVVVGVQRRLHRCLFHDGRPYEKEYRRRDDSGYQDVLQKAHCDRRRSLLCCRAGITHLSVSLSVFRLCEFCFFPATVICAWIARLPIVCPIARLPTARLPIVCPIARLPIVCPIARLPSARLPIVCPIARLPSARLACPLQDRRLLFPGTPGPSENLAAEAP